METVWRFEHNSSGHASHYPIIVYVYYDIYDHVHIEKICCLVDSNVLERLLTMNTICISYM